jgi:hypothetical protein
VLPSIETGEKEYCHHFTEEENSRTVLLFSSKALTVKKG